MRVERNGNEVEVRLFDGRADLAYIITLFMRDRDDAELLTELLDKASIQVNECQQ